MLPGVTVTCFLLSYVIALLLEVGRLAIRFPGRNALLIGMLSLGWVAHSIFLYNQLYGSVALSTLPQLLASWFEWVIFAAWGLAAAYLVLLIRNPQSAVGVFLTPVILALIGLASVVRNTPPFEPETTIGVWKTIHGISLLVGTTFICLGVAFGSMYLVQSYRLKSKNRKGFRFVLPPLEFLQSMNRMSLFVSVVGLGAGMISGVALNFSDNGRIEWLSSGIVSTFALFAWSLVAAILEVSARSSLGGRRTAYLAIANFVFLLLVLAIVLFSSHGQTTKSPASASMVAAEGSV
jgi:Cytochrome C assembly protein